jgi:hypothetical protein
MTAPIAGTQRSIPRRQHVGRSRGRNEEEAEDIDVVPHDDEGLHIPRAGTVKGKMLSFP